MTSASGTHPFSTTWSTRYAGTSCNTMNAPAMDQVMTTKERIRPARDSIQERREGWMFVGPRTICCELSSCDEREVYYRFNSREPHDHAEFRPRGALDLLSECDPGYDSGFLYSPGLVSPCSVSGDARSQRRSRRTNSRRWCSPRPGSHIIRRSKTGQIASSACGHLSCCGCRRSRLPDISLSGSLASVPRHSRDWESEAALGFATCAGGAAGFQLQRYWRELRSRCVDGRENGEQPVACFWRCERPAHYFSIGGVTR